VILSYAAYRTVFGSKNCNSSLTVFSDIPEDLVEYEAPERIGRTIYSTDMFKKKSLGQHFLKSHGALLAIRDSLDLKVRT